MKRPITETVDRALHGNMVARAIEKRRLQDWLTATRVQIDATKTGEEARALIVDCMALIGRAMRTIYGWQDDDCIGDAMADAVFALEHMTLKGYRWDEAGAGLVKEAISIAMQVLTGMDAQSRVTAELWAQGVAAANPWRDMVKEAA